MINILNDRTLESGQHVQCYRNLNAHNGKVFSIKDKKTGLVICHADKFRIENVKCHVGKGRFKVREKKQKNVHAWVDGIYINECEMNINHMQELTYDPFIHDNFINKDTGEKVEFVDLAYFYNGKCYIPY